MATIAMTQNKNAVLLACQRSVPEAAAAAAVIVVVVAAVASAGNVQMISVAHAFSLAKNYAHAFPVTANVQITTARRVGIVAAKKKAVVQVQVQVHVFVPATLWLVILMQNLLQIVARISTKA